MNACNALIHEFDAAKPAILDDDGDQMVGFYYQFTDVNEQPIGGLIGPYKRKPDCVKAAKRAFKTKDY